MTLGVLQESVGLLRGDWLLFLDPTGVELLQNGQVGLGVIGFVDLAGEIVEHVDNFVLLLVSLIVVLGLWVAEEAVNKARIVVFQEPLGQFAFINKGIGEEQLINGEGLLLALPFVPAESGLPFGVMM